MSRDSITRLFGIPGFRVATTEPYFVEEGTKRPYAIIEIVREKKEYQCPCGQRYERYYDGDYREVRDLPFGKWDVYLVFFQVRVECPHCGVKTERLDWLPSYGRNTTRLEEYVARLCELASVKAVAKFLDMDWKTVKRIDKQTLEKRLNPPNFDGLRILAIDELAIKKGHHYVTVIIDFLTKRVVWVEIGRAEKALNRFYRRLGKKRCRQIEAVAMDMWPAFMKATKKHCPRARLVFDKFHILSHMAQVIDQVRRREFKRASKKTREVIKGSRYLLLRNRAKVRGKKRIRLSELLALNKPINAVHVSKEDLKPLWDYRSPRWAEAYFREWYRRAIYSKIEPLKKFARMLKKHWEGIAAHCFYPIHTSLLEGINNKAKVIKRIAYGYHDIDYFALKLRAAFPGIPIPSPT